MQLTNRITFNFEVADSEYALSLRRVSPTSFALSVVGHRRDGGPWKYLDKHSTFIEAMLIANHSEEIVARLEGYLDSADLLSLA